MKIKALIILFFLLALHAPLVRAQERRNTPRQKGSGQSLPRGPVGLTSGGGGPIEGGNNRQSNSSEPSRGAVGQAGVTQRIVREGLAVELTIEPLAGEKSSELMEGTEATVRFKITDSNTGQPANNLRPAAWIDLRRNDPTPNARQCREKIQSFLQSSFNHRPDIDLNTYFILSLNHEANISVLDPLSGFGGSKLYSLIPLKSPGEDWVMSRDKQRLYITMPSAGQVAVIDTNDLRVLTSIDAGAKATRITLQHDEKYLWVGNEDAEGAGSGVTVIDTATLKAVAHLDTGRGQHEIAITDDDRYAFVTNKQSGTLSVIDVRRLAKIKEIKTGAQPTALAFSPLSKAVYVINEGDGEVVVIDGQRHDILTRIRTRPGLRAIRFLPNGRLGFVVNRLANVVYIFDASNNKLLHTVPVGESPDQVSFTRDFAYVRSSGDEFVTMINLKNIGKEGTEASVTRFPAGQKAPKLSAYTSAADAVVTAPGDGAVLVANPADKMIYYYMEGMAAPMGSFQNYRRDPRAVLVLDKSLRETSPGVYTTTVKLTKHGNYDVAFLLDSPRVVNCFDAQVRENPELSKQRMNAIRIEPQPDESPAYAGESYRLRFKVVDTRSRQSRSDLQDVGVLTFLAPGIWQQRGWAKAVDKGLYEIYFVPPQAGIYYIYFQCPSLGVQFNQLPPMILQVKASRNRPASALPPLDIDVTGL